MLAEWHGLVIEEGYLRQYYHGHDNKSPLSTFVALWDSTERRWLAVIDLHFDEEGRTPHREVLKKFRVITNNKDVEVIGGGVIEGSTIISFRSQTLGLIPRMYHHDIRRCLNLHALYR